MRETHIINLLEDRPLNSLTKEQTATAELHIAQCSECKRAYDAARISSALVLARASEDIEVAPFFTTRVMATVRERHLSPEASAPLVRMWRTAGTLASSMAALVVVLVALTIFTTTTDSQMQSPSTAASQNIYSPEYVVLQQDDLEDDVLTNDDVVATMYEPEDADGQ